MNKFDEIRCHYYIYQEEIIKSYPKCLCYGYSIDDDEEVNLTPIEIKVLETIHLYNIPLLPQYPIKNYFVDFGDPIRKIAIEVDGKPYHLDKIKDNKRQNEIENEGWTFYRIEGKYTYFPLYEYYKIKTGNELEFTTTVELNEFANHNKNLNSDCLILYLKNYYYNQTESNLSIKDENTSTLKHISDVLARHKIALDNRIRRRKEWIEKFGKTNM